MIPDEYKIQIEFIKAVPKSESELQELKAAKFEKLFGNKEYAECYLSIFG